MRVDYFADDLLNLCEFVRRCDATTLQHAIRAVGEKMSAHGVQRGNELLGKLADLLDSVLDSDTMNSLPTVD